MMQIWYTFFKGVFMRLIGKGRTADVYLHEGKAIKVYHTEISDEWISYELRISEIAHPFGGPKTYGYEMVDGLKGISFEYLDGQILSEYLMKKPYQIRSIGKAFGKLHKRVHEGKTTELQDQKIYFSHQINKSMLLSPEVKTALIEHLNQLEDKGVLCHGDYHVENVMIADTWRVIDWTNAYSGDPLSDVARTVMILESPVIYERAKWYEKPMIMMMAKIIKRHYLRAYGISTRKLRKWRPIVLAMRLNEGIETEKAWLLSQMLRELKRQGLE